MGAEKIHLGTVVSTQEDPQERMLAVDQGHQRIRIWCVCPRWKTLGGA